MESTGYTINTVQGPLGPHDVMESNVLKALSELRLHFQEGTDFNSYLRQLRKYALLKTGVVISDLSACSSGLLDSCDSVLLIPAAWLPAHLRAFSSAQYSGCIKTLTDITAVADTFCGGSIQGAQSLLATDPSRWPHPAEYDLLALSL